MMKKSITGKTYTFARQQYVAEDIIAEG